MHELSIAESLIEQVEESVKKCGEKIVGVEKIILEIGSFCGVEKDALEFVFPVAARDTVAQNAVLEIVEIPLALLCKECSHVSVTDEPLFVCQKCNSINVEIQKGRDLIISSLEVSYV